MSKTTKVNFIVVYNISQSFYVHEYLCFKYSVITKREFPLNFMFC